MTLGFQIINNPLIIAHENRQHGGFSCSGARLMGHLDVMTN